MNDVLLNTATPARGRGPAADPLHEPVPVGATVLERGRALPGRGEGDCDSAFGVTRLQARLWTRDASPGQPRPGRAACGRRTSSRSTSRTRASTCSPRSCSRLAGNRIGARPLLVEVPPEEALDIDEESDFRLAEAVASMRALA